MNQSTLKLAAIISLAIDLKRCRQRCRQAASRLRSWQMPRLHAARTFALATITVFLLFYSAHAQGSGSRAGVHRILTADSAAIEELQKWYSRPSGLYVSTGWWNSANAITALVDYERLSGSARHRDALRNTLSAAQTTHPGFLNDFYDDEGWWALAWIDAYDLTHDRRFLDTAESIFTDMTGRWSTEVCGGDLVEQEA